MYYEPKREDTPVTFDTVWEWQLSGLLRDDDERRRRIGGSTSAAVEK
jgi:hypothetical protein